MTDGQHHHELMDHVGLFLLNTVRLIQALGLKVVLFFIVNLCHIVIVSTL